MKLKELWEQKKTQFIGLVENHMITPEYPDELLETHGDKEVDEWTIRTDDNFGDILVIRKFHEEVSDNG